MASRKWNKGKRTKGQHFKREKGKKGKMEKG